MSNAQLHMALDAIKAGGFRIGDELERAHRICQMHEGIPLYDWIHALVHRIEGDDANARYWYRRAGKARHDGSAAEEWQVIRTAIEKT